MKYIAKVLFVIGFIIVCIGVCISHANFILSIRMLLWGMIVMWMGWLLTEFYEWREEMKYGF